ncbi:MULTISPECIES: isoprenyl transferase [Syntrophothermus]|uniref:Isoprenyl transferase n=1 Tax=Syntrophothermus lipocalidus (strain DSM 12680 / TGB-C1) TaxID=643648 RepID=D7CM34_SYNLT|nr:MULTISPECIES: isoprenyl transferase [Syntrophothermus]ADI01769.1 undecaprenyl diphosphate synthase [Syntrophothermus lipocalidus DSM 12680]HOV43827.1 isoprenyl transferase [Syntrophothermus lipocalidus]
MLDGNLYELDFTRIPQHIAIIMDGNGRWARKRLRPRSFGHRAGMESLKRTVEACSELGVHILTVYAFSTENWKRPAEEVSALMNLLLEYLNRELENLHEKNVCITIIGITDQLDPAIQRELQRAVELTAGNDGLILNIGLNYGARAELVMAARRLAERVRDGEIDVADISEEMMSSYLCTSHLPDPDLLIRTGGEMRLSNFLLWQAAYAELWFTDTLWPDFTKDDLVKAIIDYQRRDRRFGTIKETVDA